MVIEADFSVGEGFESGDRAEQGCLSGAGGSEDHQEFAGGDIETELMDAGGWGSFAWGVVAGCVVERDAGHCGRGWGGRRKAASGKRARLWRAGAVGG
jgi:hypothetical protein